MSIHLCRGGGMMHDNQHGNGSLNVEVNVEVS